MKPNMFLYRLNVEDENHGSWDLALSWTSSSFIKQFFSDNVIKGGDPHAFYEVEFKILDKLKLLCFLVDANRGTGADVEIAEALLPKSVFDDNKSYDEKYFYEIAATQEILSNVLDENYRYIYTEK